MTAAAPLSLQAIRVLVDEACTEAASPAQRGRIGGAVNWADLRCTSVEAYETDIGDKGIRAWVSEADPSARELVAFLSRHVAAAAPGLGPIEILTEW